MSAERTRSPYAQRTGEFVASGSDPEEKAIHEIRAVFGSGCNVTITPMPVGFDPRRPTQTTPAGYLAPVRRMVSKFTAWAKGL